MTVAALDHVNIVTADLAGTVAFYGELLDLSEVPVPGVPTEGERAVRWLADETGRAILHIQGYDPERHATSALSRETGPLDHVAFSCTDLDGQVARCERMGVPYRISQIPAIGLTQVFVTDPNNLKLELNFAGAAAQP